MIALAAIAMVADDILATLLVMAEARDRAVLAGILDSIMWLFSMVVTFTTITVLQGHHLDTKVLAVCAITLANFTGSMAGVQIGKRLIKQKEQTP